MISSQASVNHAPNNAAGRLISFEGPEGSGKSTQIARLAERLRREHGLTVHATREPGGTLTGEAVRNILQHNAAGEPLVPSAETLLFCASRAQLCSRIIAPALARGEWVLCDRFTDSTLAYQGYGRGFDIELLRCLNDFATGGIVPTLTLLLDLPVADGLARADERSNGDIDRFEREELDFHERLRTGFLELAAAEPQRFAIFDTRQPMDATTEAIWELVTSRLLSGE